MLMRHKSEKEEREDAEIIELLKHMHQLDRNELIARIQQRDQYIVCIIGAFIAFLVGLLQAKDGNISGWLLLGCFVAWLLMVILTYRLLESYKIHDTLIKHTQLIDDAFKKKYQEILDIAPWQKFVDDELPDHRIKSFNCTMAIFILVEFFSFLMLAYVAASEVIKISIQIIPFLRSLDSLATLEIIESIIAILYNLRVHIPFQELFILSLSTSTTITVTLYLWESDVLRPNSIKIPQALETRLLFLGKTLYFLLPFLFAIATCLTTKIIAIHICFVNRTLWIIALTNIIAVAFLLFSKTITLKIVEWLTELDADHKESAKRIILLCYIVAIGFYSCFYIQDVAFNDELVIISILSGFSAILFMIRKKRFSDSQKIVPDNRQTSTVKWTNTSLLKRFLGKFVPLKKVLKIAFMLGILCLFLIIYQFESFIPLQKLCNSIVFGLVSGVIISSVAMGIIYKSFRALSREQ